MGSPFDDDVGQNSGSLYALTLSGSEVSQHAKLIPPDTMANDNFGMSVAMNFHSYSRRVIVGAPYHDEGALNAGAAYIYQRDFAGEYTLIDKPYRPMQPWATFWIQCGCTQIDIRRWGALRNNNVGAGAVYIYELSNRVTG